MGVHYLLIKGKEYYISNLKISRLTGEKIFYISVPIRDKSNAFVVCLVRTIVYPLYQKLHHL